MKPTQAFVGYRAWRIRDWQTGLLGAAVLPYTWDGPTIAVQAEEVADLPCGGGFHAFKTEKAAVDYMNSYAEPTSYSGLYWAAAGRESPPAGEQNWAVGEVGLYGTVVEHEKGYRASHVVVRRICVSPVWSDECRARLADRYQCPVTAWIESEAKAPTVRDKVALALARHAMGVLSVKRRVTWEDRVDWIMDRPALAIPLMTLLIGMAVFSLANLFGSV